VAVASDEQNLWKAFRASCDTIFEKRNAVRDIERASTDKLIQSAEGIIQKLSHLLTLSPAEFNEQYPEVDSLKTEFAGIEGMPEKVQQALSKKLDQVLAKVENKKFSIHSEKQLEEWRELFAIKQEINLALSENNSEALDTLTQRILKSNFSQAYTKVLQEALSHSNTSDAQEVDRYYRLLCVKAEISSGENTPEEDKNLRMSYQVEQLQKQFGAQQSNYQELASEWLRGANLSSAQYEPLAKRFLTSWQRLSKLTL